MKYFLPFKSLLSSLATERMHRSLAKQDTLVANVANWSMMKTLAKQYNQNCKLCGSCHSFRVAPINLSPSQEMFPRTIIFAFTFRSSQWTFAKWVCYRIRQPEPKSDLGKKDDSKETNL